jgi:hypothetical protein
MPTSRAVGDCGGAWARVGFLLMYAGHVCHIHASNLGVLKSATATARHEQLRDTTDRYTPRVTAEYSVLSS